MTASTSGTTSGASAAAPAGGSRPGEVIMQLGTGFMATAALYAATKLGIPDILKSGPKPTSEIARACGGNEDAVYRVMRALASAGIGKTRVILMESVVAPGNEPHFAKWLDLEMLLLPGGKERTEAEFATLFEGAGFKLTRIVPTKGPLFVVEAEKV